MTVAVIGAGPGAADLLTLRAVALLDGAPVCLYAGIYLPAAVLAHCPAGRELVDTRQLDLDQIVAHLVEATARGLDVAGLRSDDPSLYSASAEQTSRPDAVGVPWEVTPGLPEYGADAPIAVVANASAPGAVVLRDTLSDIADQGQAAGLRRAAVVTVAKTLGDTAFADSHLYAVRDRQAAVPARTRPGR